MPKIEIAYDDQVARRRLADLRERGGNLAPAMREIAGHLLDSVNEAFAREASPAGKAWAPLKPATVDDRLRGGATVPAPSSSGPATSAHVFSRTGTRPAPSSERTSSMPPRTTSATMLAAYPPARSWVFRTRLGMSFCRLVADHLASD